MNALQRQWYNRGIEDHRSGKPDINPLGCANMMEMCAWSAGYFDSMRGMV